MEICPGCNKERPNVGPWKNPGDPPRLCGGCKVRRSFATPGFKERLEQHLLHAFAAVGFGNVKGVA